MANLSWERNSGYGSQGSLSYLPTNAQALCTQLHWAQDVSLTYGLEMSDSSALITDFSGVTRRSLMWPAAVFHTPALSPSLCLCKPCASCHFFLSLPLRATSLTFPSRLGILLLLKPGSACWHCGRFTRVSLMTPLSSVCFVRMGISALISPKRWKLVLDRGVKKILDIIKSYSFIFNCSH